MRYSTSFLLSLSLLALLAGCAAHGTHLNVESPYRDPATLQKGQILHLATGRIVSEPQLLEYLCGYRVIYIGETHDSLDDHAVQSTVFKGLHKVFRKPFLDEFRKASKLISHDNLWQTAFRDMNGRRCYHINRE